MLPPTAASDTADAVAKPVVYFYRKPGCHLCDDMARGLAEFKAEMKETGEVKFEVIERNIEDDPRWLQRYREYVPTLVMGRREICHYFFDKDEMIEALACTR